MNNSIKTGITLLLVALCSSGLFAQSYGPAVGYIGVRSGFITLEDVDDDGSWNFGLMGGVFLNDVFSIEGSVDFQKGSVIIIDHNTSIELPYLDRKTTALQLGLKAALVRRGPVRPFLTGGLGYYFSDYAEDDYYCCHKRDHYYEDDDGKVDDGGFYAGGGLDLFGASSNARGFGMTWDVRWLYTQDDEPRHEPRLRAQSDGWTSTLGIKLRF